MLNGCAFFFSVVVVDCVEVGTMAADVEVVREEETVGVGAAAAVEAAAGAATRGRGKAAPACTLANVSRMWAR